MNEEIELQREELDGWKLEPDMLGWMLASVWLAHKATTDGGPGPTLRLTYSTDPTSTTYEVDVPALGLYITGQDAAETYMRFVLGYTAVMVAEGKTMDDDVREQIILMEYELEAHLEERSKR